MFINKRILFICSALAITALLFCAGCAVNSGQVMKEGPPGTGLSSGSGLVVSDIKTEEVEGGVVLTVEANQPLSYSVFRLENPMRLALDLPGADLGGFVRNMPINTGPIAFIKPMPSAEGEESSEPAISRLEVFLAEPADYEIQGDGPALEIFFSAKDAGEPAVSEESVIASEPVSIEVMEPEETEPPESETYASMEAVVAEMGGEAAELPEVEAAAEPLGPATKVMLVEMLASDDGSQVIIEGDGSMEHDYFLVESRSLVVDIFSVANSISPLTRTVSDEYVKQIRVGEHFQPRKKVRIVLDLAKPTDYKVLAVENKILVSLGGLARETDESLQRSLANVVTDVYFRPLLDRSIIEIVASRKPEYQKIESEDPKRLIIEVSGSRISPEAQRTLDLISLNRPVEKIVSFQYKKEDSPVVRVVAQFKEQVPYRIDAKDNRVVIDVPQEAEIEAEEPAPVAIMEEAAPAPAVAEAPPVAVRQAEEPEASETAEEAEISEPPKKTYSGRTLSLDFREADIGDVLRLIADVSGINFVSGPEVKGRVTIKLMDVPWDLALDVILKSNAPPLTQIREAENIIRITTLENVRREENERQRMEKAKVEVAKTQEALEPLVTKSIHISYAKVGEIEARLGSFMSNRKNVDAFIQSDERTNTLIIRDLEANVDEIERIIEQLDTPTPAVQIEARIVTVNSSYTKNLGIQWGFNYVADAAHGNQTTFEFPNTVNVGGTAGGEGDNLLVNLPAASPTAGIGLTLGHIANTLTLDMRLSAMEELGQVEILSNPKVFVVQNEEAIINVGRQLPIPKTDAEGNRTVEFKDVGIMLKVIPQVTADQRIFMEVEVERSDKGEDVKTTEGEQFSIDTQRAQTKVLLNNGETSVIGGLFQQTKSNSNSKVPGLSGIPLLGWLFQSKSVRDSRQELLIFLTPKVVQPI